jgi:hypothetical protein
MKIHCAPLRHPEWLERSAITRGVTVHDLHREDPT